MTTLLTGTLERTVGWFTPRAHVEPARQFHTDAHSPEARAVPLDLRLRQWFCAASRGHAFIMGIDGPRMYLICRHCFHETSGWELGGRPPRVQS